ncbi:MAG TPA: class I SAM-dependent methyltransferase, partial [Verrucomicrobiae bacterium]|nr:class I SAM-dependent methyltransferase [Verrucomicrobiae bacterium]
MELDWSTLHRLRAGFLAGAAGHRDYWQSPADLAQYDATFAQRIGWKWDFVLNDLQQLGWQPPAGAVLDWGCGSGVASRALLDHFGQSTTRELWLSDRSALAVQFATRRAREKYPELSVQPGLPAHADLLVISHVLTELSPAGIEELLQLAAQATAVLWVEPGTYEVSRQLIAIRERLRGEFQLVAP